MSKATRSSVILLAGILLLIAGSVLLWHEDIMDRWHEVFRMGDRNTSPGADVTQGRTDGELAESRDVSSEPVRRMMPKTEVKPPGQTAALPPSPPLPQVPVESSQEQRKQAFGLMNSIDHIVLKDEPFEVGGKSYTIEQLQSGTRKATGLPEIVPEIQEKDVGSSVRRPIRANQPAPEKERVYYAVRIVKPYENLWKIHFGLFREYLARRQVLLAADADRPLADGRSSGIGRLLKFVEGVVTVYDVTENRAQKDINLIQPHSVIIYFKISDLFKALDQMQAEDLKWLRYVKGSLRVDRPQESREILDRKSFGE